MNAPERPHQQKLVGLSQQPRPVEENDRYQEAEVPDEALLSDRSDMPTKTRRRLRDLLPDRIATRIALTVVIAIVLTQSIGLLLIIGDKLPFMLPLRNIDAVTAMIAAPVDRLAVTASSDRLAVATTLSAADMTIAWQETYRPIGPDDGRFPAHILCENVRRQLRGVVDLVLMESIPVAGMADEPPMIPLPPLFGPGSESPSRHSRLWLRLIDQSWVSIEMPNARWLQFNPLHLAIWWGLSLLAILWLSLLVAKRVTRPLQHFAAAAERLGTGLDQTMLAETGPQELRQAIRAFNKMQARLKRFIDDRTQMLAAISHDLRTPISRLLLRSSALPDSVERHKMLADLNLMEHMIAATLDFARDDTLSEPQQQVDLGSLIDSLVDDAVTLGGCVSYVGPVYVACICRPVAIGRALGNLLDNAVKYGGETVIGLETFADELAITIDDHGPGIPAAALEKVFEPFFRLDPARPSAPDHIGLASANLGGVGLGLTIARNVILAHGGDVTLSNRLTGGLRVAVRLPLHRQAGSPQ